MTPRRLKKAGHGLPFQMADPGSPGNVQPGDCDKRDRPHGSFSKPALQAGAEEVAFFIRLALVCLGT